MNRIVRFLLVLLLLGISCFAKAQENTVFVYSPDERSGLHIAVNESDGWHHLGQLCGSDYGPWGAEKRMHDPSLCHVSDGSWRLVFAVNNHAPLFAAAYSPDLVTWRPQDYPRVGSRQCWQPVVRSTNSGFDVFYVSDGQTYRVRASIDFRRFSAEEKVDKAADCVPARTEVTIGDKVFRGQKFVISDDEMEKIRAHFQQLSTDAQLSSERMYDDTKNLLWLTEPVSATLSVNLTQEKTISDKLIGIFFEDISYAADGGLYAEMVQNRDFEYSERDRHKWTATTAWHSSSPITVATDNPLSEQNPHHALIGNETLWNEGWDGMAVEKGKKYDFSIYVRGTKAFTVQLQTENGTTIAQSTVKAVGNKWRRYQTVLTAKATDAKTRLVIVPQGKNRVAIDMVSLFPQETFKNRKNGLRRDLAETIAALHPKFMRFPGGCMSHGQGMDNIYHWNETVGPLHERKPAMNIWHYHQTRGLGFFEYFQFCEDIGAEPLPVLAAGVPCQNSDANTEGVAGQQGGIPMEQMPAYIDELCNLIDWANGDPATNKWAKIRADAGHPAPFNLKYIGIGNEDIIGTVFEERYTMICQALHERHPEIKVCGTVGPFHYPSADYIEGWKLCRQHPELQYMTDEHYYESTGWFLHHRDYYDSYPREGTKVYLGEWAASTHVKRPNVETALAEAIYLTDIERNGDVVEMTSYAPMLCKRSNANWDPDMIYFTNTTVRTTPAYEVQRIFSVYGGDRYVGTELKDISAELKHRIAASVVRDSKTGRRYLKLVNALPVELNVQVEGVQLPATVKCEQLTGAIDDQNARAEVIETNKPTTLPPYSLRVIEL